MNNTDFFIKYLKLLYPNDEDENNILFFKKCFRKKRYNRSIVSMYHSNIYSNKKMDKTRLNRIEMMYFNCKRHVNKLYYLLKYIINTKFIKIYDKDSDLFLIPLCNYKDRYKIKLIIDKTLYHFRISNLINIWVKCLTNHNNMFINILSLKNPYTNKIIDKYNLYNIYIKLLDTGFKIPIYITKFCLCDFNKLRYKTIHFCDIKDFAIKDFVNNGHISEKYNEINNMFKYYEDDLNGIKLKEILPIFIKEQIIKKLNKFLLRYLIIKYSCNILNVNKYKNININLLKALINNSDNLDLNYDIFIENIDNNGYDSDDEHTYLLNENIYIPPAINIQPILPPPPQSIPPLPPIPPQSMPLLTSSPINDTDVNGYINMTIRESIDIDDREEIPNIFRRSGFIPTFQLPRTPPNNRNRYSNRNIHNSFIPTFQLPRTTPNNRNRNINRNGNDSNVQAFRLNLFNRNN